MQSMQSSNARSIFLQGGSPPSTSPVGGDASIRVTKGHVKNVAEKFGGMTPKSDCGFGRSVYQLAVQ